MSLVNDVIACDLQFSIDAESHSNLNDLCSQHKVSLPAILLSSFITVIYRHTYETDFVVNYSNLDNKETGSDVKKNQAIGVDVSTNPLFTDLLQNVQQNLASTAGQQPAENLLQLFAPENGETVNSSP